MEEPISEGEITVNSEPSVTESIEIEVKERVDEKTNLVDLEELLNSVDDCTFWIFGVGGPA